MGNRNVSFNYSFCLKYSDVLVDRTYEGNANQIVTNSGYFSFLVSARWSPSRAAAPVYSFLQLGIMNFLLVIIHARIINLLFSRIFAEKQ